MWCETISGIDPEAEFADPADDAEVRAAEERLGQTLPNDLKAFLAGTNGVTDRYGTDVVWPVERILTENLSFRTNESFRDLYLPFDSLVFFGDDGGGNQFAFVRTPEKDDVFVWDHETDDRKWVAADLEQYVARSFESDGEDWTG